MGIQTCSHETRAECNTAPYLVTCQPVPTGRVLTNAGSGSFEIFARTTSATVTTLEKGDSEWYNCSVQARNNCRLLSIPSASVEIFIEGIILY